MAKVFCPHVLHHPQKYFALNHIQMCQFLAAARLDFGIGDPNKAGAIVAMGMAVAAPLLLLRKGWHSWLAAGSWVALAYFLILTQSRGGFLAALVGSILAIGCRRWWMVSAENSGVDEKIARASQLRTFLVCLAALGGLLAVFSNSGAQKRWNNITEDRSAGGRVEIWKVWPAMLVAAPSGWGKGNAAEAYHQWYQPTKRPERYLHLLSSHATWMVETGWFGRWIYLFGLLAIFVLFWKRPGVEAESKKLGNVSGHLRWLFPAAFGVWGAFVVAGMYSHVAENWRVWILPIIVAGGVAIARFRLKEWPAFKVFARCAFVAALILGVLWGVGTLFPSAPPIRERVGLSAEVGNGKMAFWTLRDEVAMGTDYGKRLRESVLAETTGAGQRSLGFALDLGVVPASAELCVFNPLRGPRFFAGRKVRVWFGEFCQSPARAEWEQTGNVRIIEGIGEFIPNWPELIFDEIKNLDAKNE